MITADQVRVGPSPIHGTGLFAGAQPIAAGEAIEYSGKRLTHRQAVATGGRVNRYLYNLNERYVIDGEDESNLARWVNHSCRPNCFACSDDNKRLLLRTMRQIDPGEELTVDYGPGYFDEFIRPHGCRCNRCRDPRPDVSIGQNGLFLTWPNGLVIGQQWSHEQRQMLQQLAPPERAQ